MAIDKEELLQVLGELQADGYRIGESVEKVHTASDKFENIDSYINDCAKIINNLTVNGETFKQNIEIVDEILNSIFGLAKRLNIGIKNRP